MFYDYSSFFCTQIVVLWLDLTTYDTAKHLILTKTSLKDNPVTHSIARCVSLTLQNTCCVCACHTQCKFTFYGDLIIIIIIIIITAFV